MLSVIDGFVALTLAHDPVRNAAVAMLAEQCVTCFDNLRARAGVGEIARRQAAGPSSGLTPRQITLLLQWGYPYVFEEFRFHITLSGRLPLVEQERVLNALQPLVRELNSEPLTIDALSVCVQARPHAPFVVARRYGFDGSTRCYFRDY